MLITSEPVLVFAAGLQCLQLPGMIIGQRYLSWRADLAQLAPVNRRLVVALGIGITFYVLGTACITFGYSHALAESKLGHALCALQAAAWTARALQQLLTIGPCWPPRVRWLHRSLAAIYCTLALSYGAALALPFGAG